MDRRFIEDSFPVKEVSAESSREKNVRHGHISTLHIWWARRPLASSRATNYAALIPVPKEEDELEKKRNFIIELSKWENISNQNIIEKAKKEILLANNGIHPKVLDPFSGGGAIPLEALRLGCKTYANDYNPVAVLLEKCLLEYPQKYGNIKGEFWSENDNNLIKDISKWEKFIYNETKKNLDNFYPIEDDGSIPVGYLWARTIPCQNPSCESRIPLLRQFWLAKKRNKKVTLKPLISKDGVKFEIFGQENEIPTNFDPSKGTIDRAVAKCLVCGSTIEPQKTRELFQKGESKDEMIAVILSHPKRKGKTYRLANDEDLKIFSQAEKFFEIKREELRNKWGIDPLPDEPTPIGKGRGAERAFSIRNYGLNNWGDLFNSRQRLALISFVDNLKKSKEKMIEEGYSDDYIRAIMTYLAFSVDMTSAFSNVLARWENTTEAIKQLYSRQTLSFLWDYAEVNPFSGSSGSFKSGWKYYYKVIDHCSKSANESATVEECSATSLQYPNDYFDAVFTDPPYYDNVPYSYLSDFFYVWLKRMLGDLYPNLFTTPLSPKSKEVVAYTYDKSWEESKDFFENLLKESFQEIYRVLKPNGITTIVYAHKTTEGWETVINALLDSGLTVTASWPLSTEMKSRLRARNSAALASSIYIVARKIDKMDIGLFKDVKEEIKKYIPTKLNRLWNEGISGADFFISAIGSAIEVFGKYKKVIDHEGSYIRASELLSFVRDVVTDYSMKYILHNGIANEISPLTKFYLLWRWNYQETNVPFDEARKLAQSAGIDLSNEWNKGFIIKRGQYINVLGPDKRKEKDLNEPTELIDTLHSVCILWKNGKKEDMKDLLEETGWGNNEAFYKVAQAISETLPNTSSEKKLIDGFLASKDRIIKNMRDEGQSKLV